ncbi:SDR family oxidoreductase [Phosphitispora sp. TUW77]|uniref:SDR family oxidoreductase n=1 Tax=Phosphitispora sp. TUW77 TaxID=3152361 RepID=UPI003AB44087
MSKLTDKVAVITGGASGIGKAIAKLYAEEGAKIVVSDIDIDGAKAVVSEIESIGGSSLAIKTDVTKEEDIQKLIDTAVNTYGTVDILVNNAGVLDNFTSPVNMTDELWEKVFAINITGPMRTIRKCIPIFLEKGNGNIVNISSVGGLNGMRGGAAYVTTKHAVVGLTKHVGFLYANSGIRCNAIAPGAVATNISKTTTNPDSFALQRFNTLMTSHVRSGDPEEIAKIALFLSSNDSSFVNGTVILADAGWNAG